MSAALREIAVVEMPDNPGGLDELLKEVVRAGVKPLLTPTGGCFTMAVAPCS